MSRLPARTRSACGGHRRGDQEVTEGRLIAVALMVGGIALAGPVTATLASWFMDRFSELRTNEARTTSEISAHTEEVRRLREELHAQRPTAPSASAEGPHTAGANGPGTTSGSAPGLDTGTTDGTPGTSGTRAPSRLA
ncbi:hypothetical protein [Streptomyces sp. NPDC058632]|uniref:hypothetical protein n=1 Tax=Streptomyces sp. NPDC058632 TaxID=3346567 RepID=UPI003666559E